ncbi:MAG: hypothetical protein BAJALOKI1v1_560020 [Promethearchaeota archaeon]|nr:MAG: hypothetical protein BAJALOKI1v1_560020 [Candidatus Lokiarchaeota archaeon]
MNVSEHVVIKCPICHIEKAIEIPSKLVNKASHLTSVLIPKSIVCEHTFHAFVDKSFAVRGYQKTDFELPSNLQEEKIQKTALLESELNDFENLKWNISPENLKYIFRGIMFNKPTVFIIPDSRNDLKGVIERAINFLFNDTFKHNLTILLKSNYKKIKNDFKNYVVIGWKKILRDKDKIMNEKDMEVEEKIVREFFRNASKIDAIINLEFEIRNIYKISSNVIDIIENLKKGEDIDIMNLRERLNERFSLDLDIQYLRYILSIVRYYFKVYVPVNDSNEIQEFLDILSS